MHLKIFECGTQEKESKGGPAVGQPRLRRLAHGCRGIPCFFFRRWGPQSKIFYMITFFNLKKNAYFLIFGKKIA